MKKYLLNILKKKLISPILGKVVSGWRVQNMSHWDLIGKRDPQMPQMFYPVADEKVTLKPGDVVAARCTMVKKYSEIMNSTI